MCPIGTLTKNEQTVCEIYTIDEMFLVDRSAALAKVSLALRRTLQVGSICNNAVVNETGKFVGQSTDVALLNVLPFFGMSDQRAVRANLIYARRRELTSLLYQGFQAIVREALQFGTKIHGSERYSKNRCRH